VGGRLEDGDELRISTREIDLLSGHARRLSYLILGL
jgi:hypothetical protein